MFINEIYLALLFSSDFDDGEILVGWAGPPGLHLDVQQPGRGGRRSALALHLLRSIRYSTVPSTSSIAGQVNQDCCNNNKSAIVSEICKINNEKTKWFFSFAE
jgi:hypothetical protein